MLLTLSELDEPLVKLTELSEDAEILDVLLELLEELLLLLSEELEDTATELDDEEIPTLEEDDDELKITELLEPLDLELVELENTSLELDELPEDRSATSELELLDDPTDSELLEELLKLLALLRLEWDLLDSLLLDALLLDCELADTSETLLELSEL